MWPFKQSEPNLISVSLNPQYMCCSLIQREKDNIITIQAYKMILFKHLEFEKSIVFNFSKISNTIKTFIKTYNIKNPMLTFSISGPNIFEKIVTLSTSMPTKEDFKIPQINKLNWQYSYLGPSVHGGFDFYFCGITREALFQYNLIAIKSGIKPIVITTPKVSHIELYKYIKDNTFRQSQFAIDLAQNNYDILSTISPEHLSKYFLIDRVIDIKQDKFKNIATMLGLFLMGRKTWKI